MTRRFPPPWSIDELAECFIVRDASGQALGYFYFDEEPQRRRRQPKLPSTARFFRFDCRGTALAAAPRP